MQAPGPHWSDDYPLQNYSLDFLRPLSGSGGVQLDTVPLEFLTKFKLDDKLLSSKLGISGLSDLYRVTIGHDDLKAMMADPSEQGDTLRKESSSSYSTFMGPNKDSEGGPGSEQKFEVLGSLFL